MLKELSIKNFAIIDDINIEFDEGLNLLTGETGSGKSIIIDALGIVLGGRGSKDLIRSGEEKAIIEALFFINDDIREILHEYGIDDEGLLIISKEISLNYPSISRINGRPITISALSKITSKLVDIFGQHEHQSLLNVSNHQLIIDSFGNNEHHELLKEINIKYELYKKEKQKLQEMNTTSYEREREIDLLKFQIDEIEDAKLKSKDDSDLEGEYRKLSNMMDIINGLTEAVSVFSDSDYETKSILDLVDRNINILNSVHVFDKKLDPLLSRLKESRYELQDISRELNLYLEGLELDEDRLSYIEERLNLVNRLKKKYGSSIEKINEYKTKINYDYERLINFEKEIEKINKAIKEYENILLLKSNKLSELRKSVALELEKKIASELLELNMGKVIFKVNFEKKLEFSSNGLDKIEFLISTNPGEELKSLSRIVSGGEMSRIMLGFKSIIADKDRMPTIIFDEIDTGISGRTAQIVGEKISKISRNHQVISISHLPQIVALADSHFVISKNITNNKASTVIKRLNEEERINEVARLISGVDMTETTINHAKELLSMSNKLK
jgi:DNA repair protein RecN (Recombination protein N)